MKFFRLEPDGDRTTAEALEEIAPKLYAAGARVAILIVADQSGVSIADATAPGEDDSLKGITDLLLKVALDAKDMMQGVVPWYPVLDALTPGGLFTIHLHGLFS